MTKVILIALVLALHTAPAFGQTSLPWPGEENVSCPKNSPGCVPDVCDLLPYSPGCVPDCDLRPYSPGCVPPTWPPTWPWPPYDELHASDDDDAGSCEQQF